MLLYHKAPALNIPAEKIFTLRRAEYVYGLTAGQIADALILLNEKPFEIAPGQVVQVWVTIDSRGLTAGQYAASLSFSGSLATRDLPKKKISRRYTDSAPCDAGSDGVEFLYLGIPFAIGDYAQ